MDKTELSDLENLIIRKKLIVFGGNKSGLRCIDFMQKMGLDLCMCVDNSSEMSGKTIIDNLAISTFYSLKEEITGHESDYVIIIASSHYDDIVSQIEKEFNGKCLYYYFNVIEDMYANYCFPCLLESYVVNPINAIEQWAQNLLAEVKFWIQDVAQDSGRYHDSYINDRSNNKAFDCKHLNGSVYDNSVVMDVGCGLCSQYGNLTATGKIKLVAVDPLAHQYNEINKIALDKNKSNDKIVQFGLFEYLDAFYSNNYADIILIDNALDHCFDPVKSIVSCLQVLKVNGAISMMHTIREAVNQNYKDLHQWNLDSNDKSEFIIWNNNGFINVTKKLKEYADITVIKEKRFVSKGSRNITGCIYISIKKIKDIDFKEIDNSKYLGYTLSNIMQVISKTKFCEDYINMMNFKNRVF
jgi:SAM-dependent methyltransferase